jgi:hypothetical protein
MVVSVVSREFDMDLDSESAWNQDAKDTKS